MSDSGSQRFDVLDVPLEGIRAIEASAGTGKTYNITGLYLRILLETDLTPERILVLTYTVAATAELRDRIRKALQEAMSVFRAKRDVVPPPFDPPPFLASLTERFPDAERAYRRLGNAVRTFDEAAIFTIHGFCQRVLAENAFESGTPLRTEMLGDQAELVSECIGDFWRRETYEAPPTWVRFLLDRKITPDRLRTEIGGLIGRPFEAVLVPEETTAPGAEEEYAAAIATARELWATQRDEIVEKFSSPGLNGQSYKPKDVPSRVAAMDHFLAADTPPIALFAAFPRFTQDELERKTNKGRTTPRHAFFEQCGRILTLQRDLETAYDAQLARLRARLLAFCNDELRRRKEERRVRFFDDLLIELDEALRSEGTGPRLAEALRERYGAALIDEFQDTDPLQYSILKSIYGEGDAPVFLVGDPKQAIYSFRGADVFAYLQARRDARARYTLDHNFRSDEGVVAGVNALFDTIRDPFVLEEIPFHPSVPALSDRAAAPRAELGLPPVRAWILPRPKGAKRWPTESRSAMAEHTADEIRRLLESGTSIPGDDGTPERLHGGHIAVLVRDHNFGQAIKQALSARGIGAVEGSRRSVFGTQEAAELERTLAAIAEPSDERLIRGALSTTLLGVTADGFVELAESENAWDAETDAFRESRHVWIRDGFGRMFRRLLHERGIPARLLASPDGERRLTNLLQLGELLTAHATDEHLGTDKLVEWLATRRKRAAGKASAPEEHLLRLESDENLVKINTYHVSKGLEFPIVFVPFLWSSGGTRTKPTFVSFHQPGTQSGRPTLDFGHRDFDEHQRGAEMEGLAEDLRLAYVALTRAKHHCTFGWSAAEKRSRSALAWLLLGEADGEAPGATSKDVSEDELGAALARVERSAAGALAVDHLALPTDAAPRRLDRTETDDEAPLSARRMPRRVRNRWRITSFSALRGGRSVDLPDRDGRPSPTPIASPAPADIFGFPKGARPGVCLHQLFETYEFTETEPIPLQRLVRDTLDQYGFAPSWEPTIERMVRDVLATPLDPDGQIRLAEVGPRSRLPEVEFHYPAGQLSLEGLNELLERHGYPAVPDRGPEDDLPRPLVDGYVKGYIDLVFEAHGRYYLADYKSNWLGNDLESYAPDRLREVVRRELYTLQYVTYTLALHRLLRLRLPSYDYDEHVGGAYYLFLRGMRPEHGATSGVFFDRPPRALIEELDERIGTDRLRAAGGLA